MSDLWQQTIPRISTEDQKQGSGYIQNRCGKITYYGRQKTEIQLSNLQAVLRKITEQSKGNIKKKLTEENYFKMKQNFKIPLQKFFSEF